MKLGTLRSKEGMSRREFLKVIRLKSHGIPVIEAERCTGCGLCSLDCPTKALGVSQESGKETYQLLFRQEACDACHVCEEVCPEHCLRWLEKEPRKDGAGEEVKVIFEVELSRCVQCGTPLFPRSMVKKLETKIGMNKEATWPFNLCPSCRIKTPFSKEMAGRTKI